MPQISCANLDTPGSSVSALFTYFLTAILHKQCEFGNIEYPADQFDHVLDRNIQIDFIVVGSGSSGSVIANRLSEISKWNILLIEAGDDPSVSSYIPALTFSLQKTSIDWSYVSEKQNGVCEGLQNNVCNVPRGKALGGSSNLNAMMHVVGNPNDYNSWGSDEWALKNIEKYFHKSFKDYYYVGFVNRSDYYNSNKMIQTIMDASKDLHLEKLKYKNKNINPNRVGTLQLKTAIRDGERLNTARAFLTPIKDRTNLFVMKNTLVTKILLENKKATAVQILRDGKNHEVKFNKELILSAGTVNSPKLLFQSGIGDEKQLEKEKVDLKLNLPSVGNYLYDHPMFVLPIELNISAKQKKKGKSDENESHNSNSEKKKHDENIDAKDQLEAEPDVVKLTQIPNIKIKQTEKRSKKKLKISPEIDFESEVESSTLFGVPMKSIETRTHQNIHKVDEIQERDFVKTLDEDSDDYEEDTDSQNDEFKTEDEKDIKRQIRSPKSKKKHRQHPNNENNFASKTIPVESLKNDLPPIDEIYNYITKKKGSLSKIGITDHVTFIDTTQKNANNPNIMLMYVYSPKEDHLVARTLLETYNWKPSLIDPLLKRENDILLIIPMLLRPISYGNITFTQDVRDNPKIFLNYFQEKEDLNTLVKSVRFVEKLIRSKPFAKYNAKIVKLPESACDSLYPLDSDEYLQCLFKQRAGSAYHLSSTCRMGDNTISSVVNEKLRVHGLENVRVADASVMPYTVSGNIHATCVMIGEKCADIIKQDWKA